MADWLKEDQFCCADLLWIIDGSAPWASVEAALRNRIPILVPDSNPAMKELCLAAGCGLFYFDAAEAQSLISVLLGNQALRIQIGENGRAYITRSPHALRPITA